jgi:hypothetical protein
LQADAEIANARHLAISDQQSKVQSPIKAMSVWDWFGGCKVRDDLNAARWSATSNVKSPLTGVGYSG